MITVVIKYHTNNSGDGIDSHLNFSADELKKALKSAIVVCPNGHNPHSVALVTIDVSTGVFTSFHDAVKVENCCCNDVADIVEKLVDKSVKF